MTIREKIIIGLVILTCCYGIYSFFFTASSSVKEMLASKTESATKFVSKITGEMNKKIFTEIDSYIVDLALLQWENDPFVQKEYVITDENKAVNKLINSNRIKPQHDKTQTGKTEIIYSGYISIGDRMLAVINGLEYEEGEVIHTTEHSVMNIFPSCVILESIESDNKLILPLESMTQGDGE